MRLLVSVCPLNARARRRRQTNDARVPMRERPHSSQDCCSFSDRPALRRHAAFREPLDARAWALAAPLLLMQAKQRRPFGAIVSDALERIRASGPCGARRRRGAWIPIRQCRETQTNGLRLLQGTRTGQPIGFSQHGWSPCSDSTGYSGVETGNGRATGSTAGTVTARVDTCARIWSGVRARVSSRRLRAPACRSAADVHVPVLKLLGPALRGHGQRFGSAPYPLLLTDRKSVVR
jgi:hypothetical protein